MHGQKNIKINGAVCIVRLPVYSSIHHVEYNTLIAVAKILQKNSTQNTCQGIAIVSAFFYKMD